jgi:hypothetical protein
MAEKADNDVGSSFVVRQAFRKLRAGAGESHSFCEVKVVLK